MLIVALKWYFYGSFLVTFLVWVLFFVSGSSQRRRGTSVNQHLRIYVDSKSLNFHLTVVPMIHYHTIAILYALAIKALDNLLCHLLDKFISISANEGSTITSHCGGHTTLLESETAPKVSLQSNNHIVYNLSCSHLLINQHQFADNMNMVCISPNRSRRLNLTLLMMIIRETCQIICGSLMNPNKL